MNFNDIDKARKLLGLSETATLKEIRAAYRSLAKRYHPDKHLGTEPGKNEFMSKLNQAYKILTDYCAEYKYSFGQEDVARVYPEEEDYRRWYDNWSF